MKVLIVTDMLNDFMEEGGALYCGPAARKTIPFIRDKIEEYRKTGGKVIYLCDAHSKQDKEFEMFGQHAVKGTHGAKIIDELSPSEEDIVIHKETYSACYKTELEEVLKELKAEEIALVGVCTSICIMEAAGELRVRGYKVVVYREGVADFDQEAHRFALKRMDKVYGVKII